MHASKRLRDISLVIVSYGYISSYNVSYACFSSFIHILAGFQYFFGALFAPDHVVMNANNLGFFSYSGRQTPLLAEKILLYLPFYMYFFTYIYVYRQVLKVRFTSSFDVGLDWGRDEIRRLR